MRSHFGYEYHTKNMLALGLDLTTIRDLDESIDILCDHFGEDDQDLSLREEHCPYFGVMWEAGVGLSQYLSREMCEGKKIIEIGCGLALPSFVATRFGGDVIATDFHVDVPLFLKINQEKNQIAFTYEVLNWREFLQKKDDNDFGQFDLVLGSDILYESQQPDQVAQALISLLKPGGKIVLSDPGRAYVQKFVSCMQALGYPEKFMTEKVEASLSPNNREREIYLFEFIK